MAQPVGAFSRLPPELLEIVAKDLVLADQWKLLRVSQVLRGVCTSLVYRNVKIRSSNQLQKLCQTLAGNNDAALAIRELNIRDVNVLLLVRSDSSLPFPLLRCKNVSKDSDRGGSNCLPATSARALQLASRIDTLILQSIDVNFTSAVHSCTFPKLREFLSTLPSSPTLVSFLLRHPELKELSLIDPFCNPIDTLPFKDCHLPNLRNFNGPAALVPIFVPRSRVEKAEIMFPEEADEDTECIIQALAQSSEQLTRLRCIWQDRIGPGIVSHIAKHLPWIRHVKFSQMEESDDIIRLLMMVTALESSLPLLQSLHIIEIEDEIDSEDFEPSHFNIRTVDAELSILEKWESKCKSLDSCVLPSGVRWIRLVDSVWIPGSAEALRVWIRGDNRRAAFGETRPSSVSHLVETMRKSQHPAARSLADNVEYLQDLLNEGDEWSSDEDSDEWDISDDDIEGLDSDEDDSDEEDSDEDDDNGDDVDGGSFDEEDWGDIISY